MSKYVVFLFDFKYLLYFKHIKEIYFSNVKNVCKIPLKKMYVNIIIKNFAFQRGCLFVFSDLYIIE